VRAERRWRDLGATDPTARKAVTDDLLARDERDRSRADSPLRCDPSYRRIDTSDLAVEAVVALLAAAVRGETAAP